MKYTIFKFFFFTLEIDLYIYIILKLISSVKKIFYLIFSGNTNKFSSNEHVFGSRFIDRMIDLFSMEQRRR